MQSTRPIKQGQIYDYISPSTQSALNLKAPLLNPSFSGTVKLMGNSVNGMLYINSVNNITSLSGTTNILTKWSSTGIITNSNITDTGAAITLGSVTTVSGNLTATNIIRSGGASSQILMADGSVGTLIGTANYVPKFTAANAIGNSRVRDDGGYVGISNQWQLSGDLMFGYLLDNRIIGIEDSINTQSGKDLIIRPRRAINFNPSATPFSGLGQTARQWSGIALNHINNDLYACAQGTGIYKQTGGIGVFVITTAPTAPNYYGIAVNPSNGDVYACSWLGDIYKQTGGVGSFVALGVPALQWTDICINYTTGDVYATVSGGDIYKQTASSGNFVALGQTARGWFSITADYINGDVYAIAGADIYKQTGGVGNFVIVYANAFNGWHIAINPVTKDFYGTVYSGDIYRRNGANGTFQPLNQTLRNWKGIAVNPITNNVHATVLGGDIYFLQVDSPGTANLNGGILKLKAGTGKGTGQSRVQIITGQITTSGTNMQTEQVVAQFDESGNTTFNGNVIISGTSIPNSIITNSVTANTFVVSGGTSSQYLMADGSVSTGTTTLIIGNLITGTTYTLVNSDHSRQLQTTNSSAVTIIVPTGLTSGFACDVIQEGFGQVSVSGSTGTTLKYSSFELPTTYEQYSSIGIVSITNLLETYKLMGQLSSI